jgi:hypothetical protein
MPAQLENHECVIKKGKGGQAMDGFQPVGSPPNKPLPELPKDTQPLSVSPGSWSTVQAETDPGFSSYEDAIPILGQVIAQAKRKSLEGKNQFTEGQQHEKNKNYQQAFECYKLSFDLGHEDALFHCMKICLVRGDRENALVYLKKYAGLLSVEQRFSTAAIAGDLIDAQRLLCHGLIYCFCVLSKTLPRQIIYSRLLRSIFRI